MTQTLGQQWDQNVSDIGMSALRLIDGLLAAHDVTNTQRPLEAGCEQLRLHDRPIGHQGVQRVQQPGSRPDIGDDTKAHGYHGSDA